MRAELAANNALVRAMIPGAVDTGMSRDFPAPGVSPAEVTKAVLDGIV